MCPAEGLPFRLLRAHAAAHAAGGTARQCADAELTERITAIHNESTGTYGAPHVHAELAEQGHRHGRKRVARLMRAAGLRERTMRGALSALARCATWLDAAPVVVEAIS